jgi:hypothetical protein
MYKYEEHKSKIFTEKNQERFLNLRDKVHNIIGEAGCITMGAATQNVGGDSWTAMAMVDRLVELKEIREVELAEEPLEQYRIFIKYD